MTFVQLRAFAFACRQAAATHSNPDLCIALAREAQKRLVERTLNQILESQGYCVSVSPFLRNGHRKVDDGWERLAA